jgi:uncharacterized protein (DUF433 family)
MSMRRNTRVVTSLEEAVENIRTYTASVALYDKLASRIKQHPAWYAVRDEAGRWMFGPSKFVGYYPANAKDYLASYSRKDGKETEPALSAWFDQVPEDTPLVRELRNEFIRFAERFGKSPHRHWRVSVTQEELVARGSSGRHGVKAAIANRIAYDPEICGGRPRIAGTRVRVSDIISALAEGTSAKEILDDYPYLAAEDIAAALNYAASAVDHRVLKAA